MRRPGAIGYQAACQPFSELLRSGVRVQVKILPPPPKKLQVRVGPKGSARLHSELG